MELSEVLPIVFAVVATGIAFLMFGGGPGDDKELRKTVARQLGLAFSAEKLSGEIDGREVTLRSELRGKFKFRVYITEIAVPELPRGFALMDPGLFATAPDDTIGDPAFDRRFRVDLGDDGLPFLDAPTREALRATVDFKLERDVLRFEGGPLSADLVRERVAFADRLARRDPVQCLRRMAESDPARRVRVRALEELAQRNAEGRSDVFVAALAAEDPLVRAVGAILLDRGGEAEALAALDDADRHRAFGLIARRGTDEQVRILLASLSGAVPRPLWLAATEAAQGRPTSAVLAALADALGRIEVDGFVADRALLALTASSDAAIEPWVLPLVPRAERSRDAALAWLAAHGTVAAVPVLDALIDASGDLDAEAAKAAVQGRLLGTPGQLSIAAADGQGGLAIPEDAAGRLSAARRAPGGVEGR